MPVCFSVVTIATFWLGHSTLLLYFLSWMLPFLCVWNATVMSAITQLLRSYSLSFSWFSTISGEPNNFQKFDLRSTVNFFFLNGKMKDVFHTIRHIDHIVLTPMFYWPISIWWVVSSVLRCPHSQTQDCFAGTHFRPGSQDELYCFNSALLCIATMTQSSHPALGKYASWLYHRLSINSAYKENNLACAVLTANALEAKGIH